MSDDEHIVVSRVFNESIEISPPYFIMDQEISPNTQPLFIFIQRKTYDSTEMLNLANIYRKHARPTDILIMFANVLGGPFTYLDSKMKDNVPCLYGSVYNSDIDSTNDAPTLQSMGYNAQVYDYEPSNTPCDQLPNGHLNCPIHTMNGTGPACVSDIATGSSSTEAQNFSDGCTPNSLIRIVAPFNIPSTADQTNLINKSDIYIGQFQADVNDSVTLRATVQSLRTNIINSSNPSCKLIMEMSTSQSSLIQMKKAWVAIYDLVDGLMIFHSGSDANSTITHSLRSDQATMDAMFTFARLDPAKYDYFKSIIGDSELNQFWATLIAKLNSNPTILTLPS